MSDLRGYRLEARLGTGATGEVWRASAPDGTRVALKVGRGGAADPRLVRLVEHEVRALSRLDHPHVAWVYDFGVAGADAPVPEGAPYVVLEHCGGGTLETRIPTSWDEVRGLAGRLLDALAHTHARGLVHLDLKPANVLWSSPEDLRPGPKLADFGIARWLGGGQQKVAGTPEFMAPEQARGEPVGPTADLFALGCLVFEQVTGFSPFAGRGLAERQWGVPGESGRPRFEIPGDLQEWLARLLAPRPSDRFRTAADAATALGALGPSVRCDRLTPPSEHRRDTWASVELDDGPRGPMPDWREPARVGPRLVVQGAGLGLVALRDPPLVGRVAERDALWAALSGVAATRSPELVVVRGPSGSGRSRLLRWLVERAAELGRADTLTVSCGQEGPNGPLRQLVRKAVGSFEPERMAQVLEPALAEALAPLLGDPDERWADAAPASALVRRLWVDRPVVLVLDDADQAPAVLRFARRLASDPAGGALLVVASVEVDAPPVDGQTSEIGLPPMTTAEQDDLLEALVALRPEGRGWALERAGGSPGRLVEGVAEWIRAGVLVPGPGGFRVADPRAGPPRPSDARARRLKAVWAGLAPEERRALSAAAALGSRVDEELWSAVCDDPDATFAESGRMRVGGALRARLALADRLVADGLARETDEGFEWVDEALPASILAADPGLAAEVHDACARHVAGLPMPANALRLGIHLEAAGRPGDAAAALIDGAEFQVQRDVRLAPAILERAAGCLVAAGVGSPDARWCQLHLVRALVHHHAGRLPEGLAEAEQALGIAVALGDRLAEAKACLRLGELHLSGRQWDRGEPWMRRLLAVHPEGSHRYLGVACGRLAVIAEGRGDAAEASALRDRGERILLACARLDPQARSFGALVDFYGFAKRSTEAERWAQKALEAAEREGRLESLQYALSKLHEFARDTGRDAEAQAYGLRGMAVGRAFGDNRYLALMAVNLAGVQARMGYRVEAHEVLLEGARRLPVGQVPPLDEALRVCLVSSSAALGQWESFDHWLVSLHAVLTDRPDGQLRQELTLARAQCLRAGQPERAEAIDGVLARVDRSGTVERPA